VSFLSERLRTWWVTLISAMDSVVHVGDAVLAFEDAGAFQLDLFGREAVEQSASLTEQDGDDVELDLVEGARGEC